MYVGPDDLRAESWFTAAYRPENDFPNALLPYGAGPLPFEGIRFRPDLGKRRRTERRRSWSTTCRSA
eukprot:15432832-Alexandrium_andersonii.AAC.1